VSITRFGALLYEKRRSTARESITMIIGSVDMMPIRSAEFTDGFRYNNPRD